MREHLLLCRLPKATWEQPLTYWALWQTNEPIMRRTVELMERTSEFFLRESGVQYITVADYAVIEENPWDYSPTLVTGSPDALAGYGYEGGWSVLEGGMGGVSPGVFRRCWTKTRELHFGPDWLAITFVLDDQAARDLGKATTTPKLSREDLADMGYNVFERLAQMAD